MDACVIWTGHVQRKGYDRVHGGLAHRVAYERVHGPIPEGMQLDHLCGVEPVTNAENMRRRYAQQTTCVNGHAYDEANTYRRPSGHRDCRACIRDRVRRYRGRAA